MKKSIVLMVFALLLTYQTAFAHHPWVEKEGGKFLVAWGHLPNVSPYDPKRVKDIKVFDQDGQKIVFNRSDEAEKVYVTPKADASMITLSFEGSYLVTTPDGKKAMTKREAQKAGMQVVDSIYYNQFAKSLFGYSNSVVKPHDLKFEIVPLKNPFTLKANELLPIKVLFDGKPIDGVTIKVGTTEVAKTDGEGVAQIQTTGQGMQVILATYRIPTTDNPDADYFSYTTVLTVELK